MWKGGKMEQSVKRGQTAAAPRSINPWEAFRRLQAVRTVADRRKMTKSSKVWICAHWDLTAPWPHLTLSISSDNSLLRWPTLALTALATLRLYFFCSSIRRSSEHFCLCRWPPTWSPTSTQQPGLRAPANKKVFSFPFTLSSRLVLDWLDCETFGVHN